MTTTEDDDPVKTRAKNLFDAKWPAHITLKDGKWRRGEILEFYDNRIIIDEYVFGKMPIFFDDILGIEAVRSKRNELR